MGDTGARKGDARDDRLSLRKTNEEVLRKKLAIEAQNICAEECKQFGECAKKSGLLVVFKCRSENLAMSNCLDKHTTDKDFENLLVREGIDPSILRKTSK
mmetsp:Transcript_60523/g.106356  ORF Transcript_60523/g.106356 Transcript_60523/m.106356 type:complete len:100 (-) Transcript_60523:108-407(-)